MDKLESVTLYDLAGNMNYVSMEAIIQIVSDFSNEAKESSRVNVNDEFEGDFVRNTSGEKITSNDIEVLLNHVARFVMRINVTDTYKVGKEGTSEGIIKRDASKLSTEEIFDMSQISRVIDPKSFGRPEVQKLLERIRELTENNSKVFPATHEKEETTEIVLETPEECKTAIEYGDSVLKNSGATEEEYEQMKKEYFDMLILDLISNNSNRTPENYGIIKDIATGSVRFSPLSNNSGMNVPGLPQNMTRLNIFLCDREALMKSLFKYYYDDIKDITSFLANNEAINLENIDYLSTCDLSEQDKNWVMPIIESNYKDIVSLEKEKRSERGEPENPQKKDFDLESRLSRDLNKSIKENLIESKEENMGTLKKKNVEKLSLTTNEYGFVGVVSVLTIFLIACCFCVLALSYILR